MDTVSSFTPVQYIALTAHTILSKFFLYGRGEEYVLSFCSFFSLQIEDIETIFPVPSLFFSIVSLLL